MDVIEKQRLLHMADLNRMNSEQLGMHMRPEQIKPIKILIGMERGSWVSTCSWATIGNWKLLGEERVPFSSHLWPLRD